ncbi:hypothetical protein Zmor_006619 [Zophobas morio]|uniref:Uncharacterized protein n=1 Tax=Zophobas morio TaxID=2755281 RepID=A0AA38IQK3_9CUCU|nr:hypothetical protein Zmor_006619 [Zophobas morio]
MIENCDEDFPLNFDKLTNFMEEIVGESDILKIAFKYTLNINGLLDMLYKIHSVLTHTSIINRNIKVQRKLKKAYDQYLNWTVSSSHEHLDRDHE